MYFKIIILFFCILVTLLDGGTPVEYGLSLSGGYDNNVMRFSKNEIREASNDISLMGGSNTFDSFVAKLRLFAEKSFFSTSSRSAKVNMFFTISDYNNTPEKKYWSGGLDVYYRWGSYRNIKYTLRHLDQFYLRHYVDRDISRSTLAPCKFTDRNQAITLTHRLSKLIWMNVGSGYLQRYYSKPFTEFDLDIFYIRGKINYRLKNIGSIALQVDGGRASNISYVPELRPSSFDRSYHTLEWYLPFRINKNLNFFNEIGISARLESRQYDAESTDDPLHAGRSHLDSKYDFWIKKSISDNLRLTISSRFRTRVTDSEFAWVNNLKSFKQIQFWFNIEWDTIYDKY